MTEEGTDLFLCISNIILSYSEVHLRDLRGKDSEWRQDCDRRLELRARLKTPLEA